MFVCQIYRVTLIAGKIAGRTITTMSKYTFQIGLSCVLAAALLLGCDNNEATSEAGKIRSADTTGIEETRTIAALGYIYGLPLVMNYAVTYAYAIDQNSDQFKAPFNQIKNEARVFTYKDTAIVTPNSDTPYSLLWMDLRAEPLVLSVPKVEEGRYYAVQLEDGNAFNFGYIGSRSTGNEAGDFLIVGPLWKGERPAGINKVYRASTPFALAIYRTQLFNPEDMANVEEIQAGYKVQPLSAFLGQPAPPPAPIIDFPEIDRETMQTRFFEYLDFILQFAPPGPEEALMHQGLARIGVGPEKKFDLSELSAESKAAIEMGMKIGEIAIWDHLEGKVKTVNGWKIGSYFGDRQFFEGNWLQRAAGIKVGIYGNDAAEAAYLLAMEDDDGDPLDGSKHDYTLTFAADEYPPVNAFWSVTMYDGATQLLFQNPIDRYLINSAMLPDLKKNADGSLTLYIQKDSPGGDKESNWLPAADGPVYAVMRLYWPRTDPPSVLPPGRGTWEPPGIMVAE
jgi:hypothetical protein